MDRARFFLPARCRIEKAVTQKDQFLRVLAFAEWAAQRARITGVGVFGSLVAGPDRFLGGMHLAMILAGVALVIG
jgi:hypothetical protein